MLAHAASPAKVAWTGRRTVLYESNWAHAYVQAGLPLPGKPERNDHTLRAVGQGLTPDEMWLLRVRWTFGKPAQQPVA